MTKDHVLKLRITPELRADLEAEAARRDRPISWVARERLEAGRHDRTEPNGRDVAGIKPDGRPLYSDELAVIQKTCPHPKDKRTNVVGGRKCMVCGAIL